MDDEPSTDLNLDARGLEANAQHGTATLLSLIEAGGATLFDVVSGEPADASPVRVVSIYDPTDATADYGGAVLLAVGVSGMDDVEAAVHAAIEQRASCVVLRDVTDLPTALSERILAHSLVVLAAVRGIPWNQLATSLSLGLDRELARGPRSFGARRQHRDQTLGDLANALDTALDAPVTIEDLNSNVLGFSDDQMRGDVSRHETILHRAVSSEFKEILQRNGTFKRLYASPEPIAVATTEIPGVDVPRIAIRISSDQRVLGSIWVATQTPLSGTDAALLKATAGYAGELMDAVNGNGTADADRRQFLVSQLLRGERDTEIAAETMGLLQASSYLITVGVAPSPAAHGRPVSEGRVLDKLAASLNLLILSSNPQGMAAVLNSHVIGVLPVRGDVDPEAAERNVWGLCERFTQRSGIRTPVHVAVSQLMDSPFDLAAAKLEGVRTIGMLGRTSDGDPVTSTVVRTDDAFLDVMLMDLHDKLLSRRPAISTPVSQLIEYDAAHGSDFVDSLVAFFRTFGSVTDAAESVHVHSNTFRYRLRRIGEICEINLSDHESRLKTMLELRIRRLLD